MTGNVIVGWDGRDGARDALALAHVLAEPTGARVTAVAVAEAQTTDPVVGLDDWRQWLRRSAHASLRSGDRDVDFRVVESRTAARGLHRAAAEGHADMLVVGHSDRRALGRLLTAGVAEQLVHNAPCAVAIAPHGYAERDDMALGTIGVGYDGGPEARTALMAAIQLAQAAGVTLRLVGMVRPPDPPVGDLGFADDRLRAELAAARKRMQKVIDEGLAGIPWGIAVSWSVVIAGPDELGDQPGVDLLFVGSRRHGPVRRVLLGSTSTALVRRSRCPVVVVPRTAVDEPPSPGREAVGARSPET